MTVQAPNQTSVRPIENFIFEGLVKKLHEIFGAHTVLSNSTDEIQTLGKLRQQDVKYPYLFASITNMAITKDAYRAMPWVRRGLDAFVSHDNLQGMRISLLPTDFVFEIKYFHNDFPSVLRFAKRWLFSSAAGWMKFTVSYGQEFDIRFLLAEDISIPKREAGPENVQEFQVIATLTIQGWSSEDKLRNQAAVTEVDVTAYLNKAAQKAGSTLFTMKKKWDTPTLPSVDEEIVTTIAQAQNMHTIIPATGGIEVTGLLANKV